MTEERIWSAAIKAALQIRSMANPSIEVGQVTRRTCRFGLS